MFILAIDYDDTLFRGSFGKKGEPRLDVIEKVKEFRKTGLCEIILWTCRDASYLAEAIERCKEYGITFDAVNYNAPSQTAYMSEQMKKGKVFATRKIYADLYVDDRSPGSIEYFLNIDVKATCDNFKDR